MQNRDPCDDTTRIHMSQEKLSTGGKQPSVPPSMPKENSALLAAVGVRLCMPRCHIDLDRRWYNTLGTAASAGKRASERKGRKRRTNERTRERIRRGVSCWSPRSDAYMYIYKVLQTIDQSYPASPQVLLQLHPTRSLSLSKAYSTYESLLSAGH